MIMSILFGLVVVLAVMNGAQLLAQHKKNQELAYIHHKLKSIVELGMPDQMPMAMEDRELRELLTDLNTLLANKSRDIRSTLSEVLALLEQAADNVMASEEERARNVLGALQMLRDLMEQLQE